MDDWAWEITVVESENRRAPRVIRVRQRARNQPEAVHEVTESGLRYVVEELCRRLRLRVVIE